MMVEKLLNKYLPVYIRFWPTNYWFAMWSAPVRYKGIWKVNKKNILSEKRDTYWEALRITIRKGPSHSMLIKVIKKGIL